MEKTKSKNTVFIGVCRLLQMAYLKGEDWI